MISNRSALPRDTRTLRRMLGEKEALLIERERIIAEKETQLAERDRVIAVRDAELYAKTLQIEHLKAQLAVLRRYRRSHLHSMGLGIAANCDKDNLVWAGGSVGAFL